MIDIKVGDVITVDNIIYPRASGNSWPERIAVAEGTKLEVTRVHTGTLTAKGPINRGSIASIRITHGRVRTVNGLDRVTGLAPVVPRKLGEKPADTASMTYIGVDHPGIQWLFDDMGQFADEQDWCSQYDDLCDELGIPNRGELFDVEADVNGVVVSAEFRGQNYGDAKEKFLEHLRLAATGDALSA